MKREKIEILIKKEEIKKRVKAIALQIAEDYKGKKPVLVSILKGGGFFIADLAREVKLDVSIDYIETSSYGKETESTGNVKIIKDLSQPVAGKDVIIVEDIIDTGYTLEAVRKLMKVRRAKSVKICVLLDKPSRRKVPIKVDYLGFEIPDLFVVGYGIDYAEKFRNLPYIAVVKNLN
jgi:hypoxanthine phosphoribosyltransferase